MLRGLADKTMKIMAADAHARDIRQDWRQRVKVLHPVYAAREELPRHEAALAIRLRIPRKDCEPGTPMTKVGIDSAAASPMRSIMSSLSASRASKEQSASQLMQTVEAPSVASTR